MFEEAFSMSTADLIGELRDMGVDDRLVFLATADPRLIRALYIYCHVEAANA